MTLLMILPEMIDYLKDILFCIIANLGNIDLQCSGLITDPNNDNPAKLREVTFSRFFSKNFTLFDFSNWFELNC